MKKVVLVLLILLNNLYARGDEYIKLGLLDYSVLIVKDRVGSINWKHEETGLSLNGLSIGAGKVINDQIDVYGGVSFNSTTIKDNEKLTNTILYSATLGVNLLYDDDNDFRPYLGFGLDYQSQIQHYKQKDIATDNVLINTKTTTSAVLPFMTLGAYWYVKKNIGLDFYIKYYPVMQIWHKVNNKQNPDNNQNTKPQYTEGKVGLDLLIRF
ncbi:MAG: hypothetical protein Ta2D_12950 [Rickettsiales bacterium]|nr:MAG: hypothetical protein Ta2D_12950 [Rickettsiales bacterium]